MFDTHDAEVLDLRELFAVPWEGVASLWRPLWARWVPAPSTDQVEAAAQAMLGRRVESIRTLAVTQEAEREKTDELAAAKRTAATAYGEAMRQGWSAAELDELGFQRPRATRRRVRKRAAKPDSNNGAPSAPEKADHAGNSRDAVPAADTTEVKPSL